MTFVIPEEELTTDGPYCLGEPRPLTGLEIAYTELLLQLEYKNMWATMPVEDEIAPTSGLAMGVRATAPALPDPLAPAPLPPTTGAERKPGPTDR